MEISALIRQESAPLTLTGITDDLAARWLDFLDVKPKTEQTYRRAIRQFLFYLADNGITQPQRCDVLAYRDHLTATGKAAATVQAYIIAVRLFFSWLAQEGIYANVADHIKGARIVRGFKKDPLTAKQASHLLQCIDRNTLEGSRNYAIIALMLTCGLRDIEVTRADIDDLRTIVDCTGLYIQGKGHDAKDDYVKIAPPVEAAIRAYLAKRGPVKKGAPLFVGISNRCGGNRMTPRSISRIVKDALKAAGLESSRLTAHSLRHTAATLNMLNGGSLEDTQQLLRHSNINTTLIYSHAIDRARNNSESRIASVIFG